MSRIAGLFRHLPVPGQIVVIVFSILMAFAVDRLWDWRQERAEEQTVLAGLQSEFEGYAADLDARGAMWDSIAGDVELWFTEVESGASPTGERVRDAARSLVYSSTWDPGSGVRDALIAAGRLEVVRDGELRRALVAWDAVLGEVQDNERVMRDFILGEMVPALAARGAPVGTLESSAPSGRSATAEIAAWGALARDPEFLALAGVRYGWLRSSIEEYGEARAFVEDLLALIRRDRSTP